MLKLFGYFTDGAIIQRGEPITIKGWCDKECLCTISKADFMWGKNCTPDETGKFVVQFPPITDTENIYTITLKQGEDEVRADVRFGDVYLTLGQSNMAYGLGSTEDWKSWLERAKHLPVAVFDMPEEAPTPTSAPSSDISRKDARISSNISSSPRAFVSLSSVFAKLSLQRMSNDSILSP